jgi:hypothetical protein
MSFNLPRQARVPDAPRLVLTLPLEDGFITCNILVSKISYKTNIEHTLDLFFFFEQRHAPEAPKLWIQIVS